MSETDEALTFRLDLPPGRIRVECGFLDEQGVDPGSVYYLRMTLRQ